MYVSWKQGDPTIKADVQIIKPKVWTNLKFGTNGELIKPTVDGLAQLGTYINVKDTGNSSVLLVRFCRDPKGVADFTGETAFDLTKAHRYSHTWFIQAKKNVSISVQVYHEGSKPISIATREFKAAIG